VGEAAAAEQQVEFALDAVPADDPELAVAGLCPTLRRGGELTLVVLWHRFRLGAKCFPLSMCIAAVDVEKARQVVHTGDRKGRTEPGTLHSPGNDGKERAMPYETEPTEPEPTEPEPDEPEE
jgi:hypothetical protein